MFAEIDGVKNHQSKCKKRDFLSNLAECQEVWYNKFILHIRVITSAAAVFRPVKLWTMYVAAHNFIAENLRTSLLFN